MTICSVLNSKWYGNIRVFWITICRLLMAEPLMHRVLDDRAQVQRNLKVHFWKSSHLMRVFVVSMYLLYICFRCGQLEERHNARVFKENNCLLIYIVSSC